MPVFGLRMADGNTSFLVKEYDKVALLCALVIRHEHHPNFRHTVCGISNLCTVKHRMDCVVYVGPFLSALDRRMADSKQTRSYTFAVQAAMSSMRQDSSGVRRNIPETEGYFWGLPMICSRAAVGGGVDRRWKNIPS